MKAKELQIGDSIFLPDMQFRPGKVIEFWYSTPDHIVVSLHNGFGIQIPIDEEILVGRKGQVL